MMRLQVMKGVIVSILAWIVLGAIAGWVASMITGTREGWLANVVVGILGAVIGGLVLQLFGASQPSGFNVPSVLTAILGAVILLGMVRAFRGSGSRL